MDITPGIFAVIKTTSQVSCAKQNSNKYSYIYIAYMSPTLSGSSALSHVKLSDALKTRDGIIFDFYPGLPHSYSTNAD